MSTLANKLTHEAARDHEPERYEFREAPIHHFALERRDFFKFFGAGLMVFAAAKEVLAQQESGGNRRNHSDELPKEITAWLHIAEDGGVTAFTGKVEIGQNIRTSLAQSVADELRVPFESVRLVMGDTQLTPFDMGTFGSRTTPTMAPQLRRVASAARDLLLQTAAKEWNTAPEKLLAANGENHGPRFGTFYNLRGRRARQNARTKNPRRRPDDARIRMDNRRQVASKSKRSRVRHRPPPIHFGFAPRGPAVRQSPASAILRRNDDLVRRNRRAKIASSRE